MVMANATSGSVQMLKSFKAPPGAGKTLPAGWKDDLPNRELGGGDEVALGWGIQPLLCWKWDPWGAGIHRRLEKYSTEKTGIWESVLICNAEGGKGLMPEAGGREGGFGRGGGEGGCKFPGIGGSWMRCCFLPPLFFWLFPPTHTHFGRCLLQRQEPMLAPCLLPALICCREEGKTLSPILGPFSHSVWVPLPLPTSGFVPPSSPSL